MRVAAVQMNSNEDLARNLGIAERLVSRAAEGGAELIALPERWNLLAGDAEMAAGAEQIDGPSLGAAREWAAGHGVHLLAGSIAAFADAGQLEVFGEGQAPRAFNTSVLIGPDGSDVAIYRKIHQFDVDVDGVSYRESAREQAGSEIVLAPLPDGHELGMSICYDLRFPELYRALAERGADVVAVPAAFTAHTGEPHWEVLLRARAIEDQLFVIAPGQYGEAPPHYRSHGHSMIIDPWGVILAQAADGEDVVFADLDFARLAEVRESLPSLANRRPDVFGGAPQPTLAKGAG